MLPVSEVSVVVKVSYSLVVSVAHWSKLLNWTFKYDRWYIQLTLSGGIGVVVNVVDSHLCRWISIPGKSGQFFIVF